MFFTAYDPLTKSFVEKKIQAHPAADHGTEDLTGLSFDLHLYSDFAPEEYSCAFLPEGLVSVSENHSEYRTTYRAVSSDDFLLISFLIPGTDRGWHLILNRETGAAAAFETWFGITIPVGFDLTGKTEPKGYRDIPREVQRQIYFGWADFGTNPQPEFFTRTNRIEGKGLHWDFDFGYEILTFNPSINATTIVELGKKEMGGITMANPADYIRLDDEHYIYSRGECEFSGKLWIELINLFDMEAIGLDLGFEEDDSFTYRFHKAVLTMTGNTAHMEGIADNGDGEPSPLAKRMMSKKGARYVYRPKDMHLPMTTEEAREVYQKYPHIFDNVDNVMDSGHNMAACAKLVGRTFKVRPDRGSHATAPWNGAKKPDFYYEYEFIDGENLKFREKDGEWSTAIYRCFEPDKDLFLFAHMVEGDPDATMLTQIVDFKSGLATTIPCRIGNWHSDWESGAEVKFGTLEYRDLKPPFARRHHFTDELVGCSLSCNYTPEMNSIHMYSSPESLSWTIVQSDNSGGATWSAPAFYIKLRENVYVVQWVEENCNGNQGLIVVNKKLLHDGGFFYGPWNDSFKVSVTGAYMRDLGKLDILKYFDKDM